MAIPRDGEVTRLLRAWGDGRESVLDKLIPLIQGELHRLARQQMQRERPGHTLQATALVNEAYLRLAATHASPGTTAFTSLRFPLV